MPTLAESRRNLDPTIYERVNNPAPAPAVNTSLEPTFNSFLRCPLPPVAFTPDSSRSFYKGGSIPQSRLLTPTTLSASPTGAGAAATVVASTSTTTNTKVVTPVATNASLTTPVLDSGEAFFGVLTMSKTFDLLQITTSAMARVRFYATASEQAQDVGRDADTALPAGTSQDIIADVTLDTDPMLWMFTPIPTGTNGDNPRSNAVYCTVENVDVSSVAITASVLYLPTEL